MKQRIIQTPVGRLLLGVRQGKLCEIRLQKTEEEALCFQRDPVLDEAESQIAQYFAGERRAFDLPLEMVGTAFERAVWQRLLEIPLGEIRTYGQIAAQLSRPKASRAVGGACSRNPLLIVVPCHRVIAASGALTGFAAGLEMKRGLLALEGWDVRDDCVKTK